MVHMDLFSKIYQKLKRFGRFVWRPKTIFGAILLAITSDILIRSVVQLEPATVVIDQYLSRLDQALSNPLVELLVLFVGFWLIYSSTQKSLLEERTFRAIAEKRKEQLASTIADRGMVSEAAYQRMNTRLTTIFIFQEEIIGLRNVEQRLRGIANRPLEPTIGPHVPGFKLDPSNPPWGTSEMHGLHIGEISDFGERWLANENDKVEPRSGEFLDYVAPGEEFLPTARARERWRHFYMQYKKDKEIAMRSSKKVEEEIQRLVQEIKEAKIG